MQPTLLTLNYVANDDFLTDPPASIFQVLRIQTHPTMLGLKHWPITKKEMTGREVGADPKGLAAVTNSVLTVMINQQCPTNYALFVSCINNTRGRESFLKLLLLSLLIVCVGMYTKAHTWKSVDNFF